MRRKEREVKDTGAMLEIAGACDVCRIGLMDGEIPYIVPMNFGYEMSGGTLTLYFHGACEGRKIDLIRGGSGSASFEMDTDHHLVQADVACDYTYRYQSIMGSGRIEILEDTADKLHGLKRIMEHYAGGRDLPMDMELVRVTAVLKLTVTSWTCKRH